jgi:sulfoxide reductase heme-binding subunit YedZ
MSKRAIFWMNVVVWVACLSPLAWLIYRAVFTDLGADPTRTITFATGLTTIRLLVISLAITPLRRVSPRLSFLIKFRRELGLFTFFYASLHLLTYIGLYSYFDVHAMTADILKRRYITAGIAAWLVLLPLALTSTNWAIRKLGGKRWQALHRLVYLAAVLAVLHYWWLVKPGVLTPMWITFMLAVLFAARPALSWWQKRKRTAEARRIESAKVS